MSGDLPGFFGPLITWDNVEDMRIFGSAPDIVCVS